MAKRVVIVGAGGQIGLVHLLAFLKILTEFPEWSLGICTSNPGVREGRLTAGHPNNLGVAIPETIPMAAIRVYDDYVQVLADPEVHLVVIAFPTDQHKPMAIAAAKARKHVLVEKPMAFTGKDTAEMLSAASAAQCYLFCGQILGYFPDFHWLDKFMQDDVKFGKLVSLHLMRHIRADDHTALPANASRFFGPTLDLLSHCVHFMRMRCGAPSHVVAGGQSVGDFVKAVNATFYFPNQPYVVTVDTGATLTGDAGFEHGFHMQLERATATYGSNGPELLIRDLKAGTFMTPGMPSGDTLGAFCAQARRALSVIDGKERDLGPLSAAFAADAVRICLAATHAVKTKGLVEIQYK